MLSRKMVPTLVPAVRSARSVRGTSFSLIFSVVTLSAALSESLFFFRHRCDAKLDGFSPHHRVVDSLERKMALSCNELKKDTGHIRKMSVMFITWTKPVYWQRRS